jgi:hypothetical protein
MSEVPPASRATYIIICNGRIGVALASSGFEMIRAASQTATNLMMYYRDRLSYADTEPISKLQHEMMDAVSGTRPAGTGANGFKNSSEMVDEMFALFDALEDRMGS